MVEIIIQEGIAIKLGRITPIPMMLGHEAGLGPYVVLEVRACTPTLGRQAMNLLHSHDIIDMEMDLCRALRMHSVIHTMEKEGDEVTITLDARVSEPIGNGGKNKNGKALS